MARQARLDMRLDEADDFLIRRAAEAAGTTVTAFVLDSARTHAAHLLADRTVFVLDDDRAKALDRRLRAKPCAKRRLTELAGAAELFR
ncbi:MAG: DUF1778 domain-containing protein [Acidimicrobiales bacterium]|nr:DUF1778 domain-containing protein [Acidimicrobiales bacterium]